MPHPEPTCIDCALNTCRRQSGDLPAFCPTRDFTLEEQPQFVELIEEDENKRLIKSAAHSAHVSFRDKLSRLDETILFARGFGAQKIGVAACVSLATEARFAAKALRAEGFEVVGAICKIGRLSCDDMGVPLEDRSSETVLCNPIYQAQVLNEAETDLNVVVGLCAGHDALFFKYADAPCTVLTAKDFKYDNCSINGLRP